MGISHKDLATACQMRWTAIAQYEQDVKGPTLNKAIRLASFLTMSLDGLTPSEHCPLEEKRAQALPVVQKQILPRGME